MHAHANFYSIENCDFPKQCRCTGAKEDGDTGMSLGDGMEELKKYFDDTKNPSLSRRCAAVLMKVVGVSKILRLSLEIDSSSHESVHHNQYSISFLSIISRVLEAKFEGNDISTLQFYWEVRDFLLSYRCENDNEKLHGGSLNLLMTVLYRHVNQWLVPTTFRPVETCDEFHCLLSSQNVGTSKKERSSARCGRCYGIFSLSYLNESTYIRSGFYDISVDLLSCSKEIWICPLCLQDDTTGLSIDDQLSAFYLNEWGSSSAIPWYLNPFYADKCKGLDHDLLESLFILSNPRNFSMTLLKSQSVRNTIASDGSFVPGIKIFQESAIHRRKWTCEERLSIFSTLSDVFLLDTHVQSWILSRVEDIESLVALGENVSTGHYRDIEKYLDHIQSTAGERVTSVPLFDISPLQLTITRDHLVCSEIFQMLDDNICRECRMSSIKNEEEENVNSSTKKWRCENCHILYNGSGEKVMQISRVLANVLRRKNIEDKLASTRAMKGLEGNGDCVGCAEQRDACAYCGKSENDICSPFVIGQNIFEFMCYHNYPEGRKFPLLPYTSSDLNNRAKYMDFPVVHEICALEMHIRRINNVSSSGLLTDKIKWKTDEIIRMLGISLKPLGCDNEGRTFWKFPGSNLLFLSCPYVKPTVQNGWYLLLPYGSSSFSSNACSSSSSSFPGYHKSSPTTWYIVRDTKGINSVIDKLGYSSNEMTLKYQLLQLSVDCSETIDFNVVLQHSILCAAFTAKYCRYDVVPYRSRTSIDSVKLMIDSDSFCFTFEPHDCGSIMVQALEFVCIDGGCHIEPHVILDTNEEMGFLWNDINLCADYVNSRSKYYCICLLDSEGARIDHKLSENKIQIVYQVARFLFLPCYNVKILLAGAHE